MLTVASLSVYVLLKSGRIAVGAKTPVYLLRSLLPLSLGDLLTYLW